MEGNLLYIVCIYNQDQSWIEELESFLVLEDAYEYINKHFQNFIHKYGETRYGGEQGINDQKNVLKKELSQLLTRVETENPAQMIFDDYEISLFKRQIRAH